MSWPTPAAVLQAPSKAAAPDSRNKLRTKIAKVLRIGNSIGFDCVPRNVGRAKEKDRIGNYSLERSTVAYRTFTERITVKRR